MNAPTIAPAPDLSLVMPCYDEEEVVEKTVTDLLAAFARTHRRLELVAVDNGSRDRTGEILARLAREHPELVAVRVEVNEGYGNGILAGLPRARAPWVGILCADGQVAAEDVAALFESAVGGGSPNGRAPGGRAERARASGGPPVDSADAPGSPQSVRCFKVRRRFRQDGLRRKVVSIVYNLAMLALFPGLGSLDVNGNPKILPREVLSRMRLGARDWFLDAEILLEARRLHVPIVERDVAGHARAGGVSNVRASTCLEFARNILARRFGGARSIGRSTARQAELAGAKSESAARDAGTARRAGLGGERAPDTRSHS